MIFLLLLLIGLLAGVLAGLLGIGGGLLFTPVLFFLFRDKGIANPVLWAVGSSLFCTFISALSSSIRQRQQRNSYWKEGLKVGLLGVAGTFAGKQVVSASFFNDQLFASVFIGILLLTAMLFIRQGSLVESERRPVDEPLSGLQSLLAGGAGGFVAVLAGIGGGGVIVPALNLGFRLRIVKAVSISSLAIVFISAGGWVQMALSAPHAAGLTGYTLGYVDFGADLPLVLGGFMGGFAGAWLNIRVPRRILQWLFGLLALALAVKMMTEVF